MHEILSSDWFNLIVAIVAAYSGISIAIYQLRICLRLINKKSIKNSGNSTINNSGQSGNTAGGDMHIESHTDHE